MSDLNLRKTAIPPRLDKIRSPYEPVTDTSCEGLTEEIRLLTEILGPDLDEQPPSDDASPSQRAGDGAADLTLSQVASTASGFLPYRSILRTATGASAHERRLREVYDIGVRKRAYLKGLGASQGCAPPAAPDPASGLEGPGTEIEYRGN